MRHFTTTGWLKDNMEIYHGLCDRERPVIGSIVRVVVDYACPMNVNMGDVVLIVGKAPRETDDGIVYDRVFVIGPNGGQKMWPSHLQKL